MIWPQRRYSDWKAPTGDGQVLVWPDGPTLLAETRAAADVLGKAQVPIAGVPLGQWRQQTRALLGHGPDAGPLLATGHQTELFHAGVWAKNALIDIAAKALNGRAMHLGVDTDHPKHLQLRWPGVAIPLTDDPHGGNAEWSGLLAPPTEAHRKAIDAALAAAARHWSFVPMLGDFLKALWRLAPAGRPLATALLDAQQEMDAALGLTHQAALASPLWESRPYLAYVHHLLADAPRMATIYNAALDEYRRRTGKHSATRPMPDLRVEREQIEVPFWLDDLAGGRRRRACVKRRGEQWALVVDDDAFLLDARRSGEQAAEALEKFLVAHQARVSPRALTLTLFVRLVLCDQFVHGIGGARYDQITDALILNLFDMEPPPFAVATATLYFPEALGRERVCLACLLQEGHRLRHGALGPVKQALVEKIAGLPRHGPGRREAFAELHKKLREAAGSLPGMAAYERRLAQAREALVEEGELFNRELFYLIQPRERLSALIEHVNAAFCDHIR